MAQEKQPISIVTDSTADLPKELAEQFGIDVIPMLMTFPGNQSYRDRIDIGMQEFLSKLKEGKGLPTTGAPGQDAYIEVYQRYPGNILSIHAGSKYSRILAGAITAANEIGEDKVHPPDSGKESLCVGFFSFVWGL